MPFTRQFDLDGDWLSAIFQGVGLASTVFVPQLLHLRAISNFLAGRESGICGWESLFSGPSELFMVLGGTACNLCILL